MGTGSHAGRKLKGTYFRRINDIQLAFDKFGVERLTGPAKFVVYYWGCEKLARALIGIANELPAPTQFPEDKSNPFKLTDVRASLLRLGMTFDEQQLRCLFDDQKNQLNPTSAKRIRDRLFHDFGPTQIGHVLKNQGTLHTTMLAFLKLRSDAIDHLNSVQQRVAAPTV